MRTLLPGDNPQAYIPEDRRRALARGGDLPVLANGSARCDENAGTPRHAEPYARTNAPRRGA
jgi:hypothetical protein